MIIYGKKIETNEIKFFDSITDVIDQLCDDEHKKVKASVYGCLNHRYGHNTFHGWELHWVDVCKVLNENQKTFLKFFEKSSQN